MVEIKDVNKIAIWVAHKVRLQNMAIKIGSVRNTLLATLANVPEELRADLDQAVDLNQVAHDLQESESSLHRAENALNAVVASILSKPSE